MSPLIPLVIFFVILLFGALTFLPLFSSAADNQENRQRS